MPKLMDRSAGVARPRAGGDLHHGLRPIRAARVRGPRRRLPAEAVQRERFQEAIVRARERIRAKATPPAPEPPDLDALVRDARPRTGPAEHILIRDGATSTSCRSTQSTMSSTGRLHGVQVGREAVSEGPDVIGRRSDARSRALCPDPPLVHPECRSVSKVELMRRTAGWPSCATAPGYR